MKAVWVDHGQDFDPNLAHRYDVTDCYLDVRDPKVDLATLERIRNLGFNPGFYLCSQGDGWPSATTTSGTAWADWAYTQVQAKAPGTSGAFPKVLINAEVHSVSWLSAMFKHWRAHSPRRWTGWSMEGHQGGWMTSAFVELLISLKIDAYFPQSYIGDMQRMESDRVVLDLVARGIPASRIFCAYDASQLGYWSEGLYFTQGRLPA